MLIIDEDIRKMLWAEKIFILYGEILENLL